MAALGSITPTPSWKGRPQHPLTLRILLSKEVRPPLTGDQDAEAFREAVENLAGGTLLGKDFSTRDFAAAMAALPMDFDELYRLYVGKNVLNHFRQDQGYKQGTYLKLWQGREDNEHLIEVMSALDTARADAPELLYAALVSHTRT